jgi:zinc protease
MPASRRYSVEIALTANMFPLRKFARLPIALLFALSVAACISSHRAAAQTAPAAASQPADAAPVIPRGIERMTRAEGITEYRVSANGLRVLLFPDASKQTATVNVTYLVGSRQENYGETGMAHLLEHLMFKGSPKYPHPDEQFSKRGARNNGSTWLDRTNYFETFPATPDNLRWALEFEADRMLNAFIARKDLDSEMTVVRNEFERGENSPPRVLFQRVQAAAFDWHSYGKTTIGNRSDIENVSIERLQAFYHLYYQPDNAVLLIAGRFDADAALRQVAEFFGPMPKPERALPILYTEEPAQDGERSVTVHRSGDNQSVQIAYHVPAFAHPDTAALSVLALVLGDTPGGRLHKALVEPGKAVGVGAWNATAYDPNLMFFYGTLRKTESTDAVRDAMIREIDSIAKDGTGSATLTAEVERVKTKLLKQFELGLAESDSFAVALSEAIAAGDWRLYFLSRDRVRAVTAGDVVRVAKNYLKADNRTVGVFIPTEQPDRVAMPPRPDIVALLKDYKGDAPPAAGEAFEPSYANIDVRTTRTTLANGIKLAMLPKTTRGNTVSARIALHYGDEQSLTGRTMVDSLAGSMLMRGTRLHTRDQIQQEFERLKADVSVGGGGATLQTTRENLAPVLKLVAEILREPAFPESEFEQLKRAALASIENQRTEPDARASNALARHLSTYPRGNIRYVRSFDETIEDLQAVDIAAVKRLYADLYGATGAEIAVVGDFDPVAVRAEAEDLFAGWVSPHPFTRIADEFRPIKPEKQVVDTPDKANAAIVAAQPLQLSENDPDYAGMVVANYIFGASTDSRLFKRIREKDGLSYSVRSGLNASFFDRVGRFSFSAIAAPQNIASVEAAFLEEVRDVLDHGFNEREVADAKSGLLRLREVARTSDDNLSFLLTTLMHQNIWMKDRIEFERRIAALTPADITAVFRRYVDPGKLSFVNAGDFRQPAGK